MDKLHEIAEQLVNLTIKETAEIQIILEEDYGIKPPESVEIIQDIPEIELEIKTQTEFNVVLIEVPQHNRIKAVRLIKEMTNLGLIDSKTLIDEVPSTIFEGIGKEQAESYAQQLIKLDCTVEIK